MQSNWRARLPFASQVYEKRVAKLPQGTAPLYSTQGRNDANENSAVVISFQVGELLWLPPRPKCLCSHEGVLDPVLKKARA